MIYIIMQHHKPVVCKVETVHGFYLKSFPTVNCWTSNSSKLILINKVVIEGHTQPTTRNILVFKFCVTFSKALVFHFFFFHLLLNMYSTIVPVQKTSCLHVYTRYSELDHFVQHFAMRYRINDSLYIILSTVHYIFILV